MRLKIEIVKMNEQFEIILSLSFLFCYSVQEPGHVVIAMMIQGGDGGGGGGGCGTTIKTGLLCRWIALHCTALTGTRAR